VLAAVALAVNVGLLLAMLATLMRLMRRL